MMNKKNFVPTLYPLNKDISKTWFVKYKDDAGRFLKVYGKLNSFSTVAERTVEANRIIKDILTPGEKHLINRNELVKNLSDLLEFRRPMLAYKTYQDYFSLLKKFSLWYRNEQKTNKQICPGSFIRFLFDNGHHKNYIHKIVAVFNRFFKDLKKSGLYRINPFEDVKVKRVKGTSKLPFSVEQKKMLQAVIGKEDPQLWFACEMEYYTYIRPNELRLLKIADIDFNTMLIHIRAQIAKDKDSAAVVIPKQLEPKIKALQAFDADCFIFSKNGLPGGKPLSKNNFNGRHRAFTKSLGFGARFTFYSWVHTGIKEAAMSNLPVKQLQMQKRHYSLDMFNEYLKDLRVEDNNELRFNFPSL